MNKLEKELVAEYEAYLSAGRRKATAGSPTGHSARELAGGAIKTGGCAAMAVLAFPALIQACPSRHGRKLLREVVDILELAANCTQPEWEAPAGPLCQGASASPAATCRSPVVLASCSVSIANAFAQECFEQQEQAIRKTEGQG